VDWLEPIYDALHARMLALDVLHGDETTFQVLHEKGRAPQTKSYLWVYRTSGDAGFAIVLCEYQTGRGSEYPIAFLAGFNGFLHTDGWPGGLASPNFPRQRRGARRTENWRAS